MISDISGRLCRCKAPAVAMVATVASRADAKQNNWRTLWAKLRPIPHNPHKGYDSVFEWHSCSSMQLVVAQCNSALDNKQMPVCFSMRFCPKGAQDPAFQQEGSVRLELGFYKLKLDFAGNEPNHLDFRLRVWPHNDDTRHSQAMPSFQNFQGRFCHSSDWSLPRLSAQTMRHVALRFGQKLPKHDPGITKREWQYNIQPLDVLLNAMSRHLCEVSSSWWLLKCTVPTLLPFQNLQATQACANKYRWTARVFLQCFTAHICSGKTHKVDLLWEDFRGWLDDWIIVCTFTI